VGFIVIVGCYFWFLLLFWYVIVGFWGVGCCMLGVVCGVYIVCRMLLLYIEYAGYVEYAAYTAYAAYAFNTKPLKTLSHQVAQVYKTPNHCTRGRVIQQINEIQQNRVRQRLWV
jgi:hypothetical protein